MKTSIKKGFGFGLTSGIITTLGLIIGLYAGTNSKIIIIGGILVIAIADSLSDALGMHISEEAGSKNNTKHVWETTFFTFLFKLIFALSFIIPIMIFELKIAIIISIIWSIFLLSMFSFYIAKEKKLSPIKVISEHVLISILVIIISYFVGNWASGLGS